MVILRPLVYYFSGSEHSTHSGPNAHNHVYIWGRPESGACRASHCLHRASIHVDALRHRSHGCYIDPYGIIQFIGLLELQDVLLDIWERNGKYIKAVPKVQSVVLLVSVPILLNQSVPLLK